MRFLQNELGSIGKEVVVAESVILLCHSRERVTEETNEAPQSEGITNIRTSDIGMLWHSDKIPTALIKHGYTAENWCSRARKGGRY
jgi:hypothetical protein